MDLVRPHLVALLPFFLAAVGCSTSTPVTPVDLPGDAPAVVTTSSAHPGVAGIAAPRTSAFEECLAGGGALVDVQTVDNNDTTAHGDVITIAVGADRTIAVAAMDGSVKFWTLEGFVGVAGGPVLTYGPEVATPIAADLAWNGANVAVGDVSGLVTGYDTTGAANILGGVEPGTSITAVAVDASKAHLAHADVRAGGHVTVRSLGGTDVVGPLLLTMDTVRDLAFMPDGTLLIAGGLGAPWPPSAVVERWDATPGAPVQLVRYQDSGTDFLGIATSSTGDVVAAAAANRVVILDATLHERAVTTLDGAGLVAVDVALGGHFAFTAGADGTLRVLDTATGAETTHTAIADPVSVRIDPAGELLFVASRGGLVHALACR